MTTKPRETPDVICEHCGEPSQQHWAVNWSDGQQVSGTVLICPRNVFRLQRGPKQRKRKTATNEPAD